VPCHPHSSWFYHSNSIWLEIHIKLLIM
jgi:hypothetical protein